MGRLEVAARAAEFADLNDAQVAEIGRSAALLHETPSVSDVVSERAYQLVRWDEHNKQTLVQTADTYIGLATTYLGGASCSYRNTASNKREMLVKAAAVLLQAIDRIDDGTISL